MVNAAVIKTRLKLLGAHYGKLASALGLRLEGEELTEVVATLDRAFFLLLFAQVEAIVVWKVRQKSEDIYQTLMQEPLQKGGAWGFKGLVDWLGAEQVLPVKDAEKIVLLYDNHRNPLVHGRELEEADISFEEEMNCLAPFFGHLLS